MRDDKDSAHDNKNTRHEDPTILNSYFGDIVGPLIIQTKGDSYYRSREDPFTINQNILDSLGYP